MARREWGAGWAGNWNLEKVRGGWTRAFFFVRDDYLD